MGRGEGGGGYRSTAGILRLLEGPSAHPGDCRGHSCPHGWPSYVPFFPPLVSLTRPPFQRLNPSRPSNISEKAFPDMLVLCFVGCVCGCVELSLSGRPVSHLVWRAFACHVAPFVFALFIFRAPCFCRASFQEPQS